MSAEPNEIVRTSRQVIEKKLLTALGEGNQVAVLFTKQDLEYVIAALRGYEIGERRGPILSWGAHMSRRNELAEGMEQLLREAFPK